ncbi:MAG: sulfite exporter TauE/SafE family protein [Geminicoccaceae bacterium]
MFPEAISDQAALVLIATSAGTSFFTAAFGIGGGVLLLAIMGLVLPAHALIPVHGVVQIGSNAGRTAIMIRQVKTSVLLPFLAGSVIGATAGGSIALQLPPAWMKIGLGLFIMVSVWRPKASAIAPHSLLLGGAFSSFLTMFFGATGPFVATLVKALRLNRLEHVATHGACMTAQHAIKVATFGLLGFAYGPWLPLVIAMIASGFIGTLLGRKLLEKLKDHHFHNVLKGILTLLALKLIHEGWQLL